MQKLDLAMHLVTERKERIYNSYDYDYENQETYRLSVVRVAYEVGLYEKLSFNEIGDKLSKLLEESTGLSKGFGSGW